MCEWILPRICKFSCIKQGEFNSPLHDIGVQIMNLIFKYLYCIDFKYNINIFVGANCIRPFFRRISVSIIGWIFLLCYRRIPVSIIGWIFLLYYRRIPVSTIGRIFLNKYINDFCREFVNFPYMILAFKQWI